MDRGLVLFVVVLAGCAEQRPPPVEYVKKSDWQPAPSVQAREATSKAKEEADAGPPMQPEPMSLTKHKPIPETTFKRGRPKK
jgi:hypothetical protein